MTDFLNLFLHIYNWIKVTTILQFSIGEVEVSITMLHLLIGGAAICIGIDVIHNIFDY